MKTGLLKTSVLLLTTAVLFTAGCSSSSSSDTNNGTLPVINGAIPGAVIIDPTAPTGTGTSTTTTFSGGSTVAFQPTNLAQMNKYVATHPLNNPTDFKISVNLAQAGSGRYGGTVSISYTDNGIRYNGEFKSGMGTNQSFKGMYDNGKLESEFNYWFNYNGKLVFTGFFEDQYGSITITLEPTTVASGGNDAEPTLAASYKGTVYFKNFTTTFAQHSPYRACWHTYTGPYDCRSNIITTKCGLYPGAEAGYQVLGTFSNLNVNSAFSIQ
ncbi:hypothetical protein CIK05_07295 [Bdellovibrio sp. qaytius]|nr:hypothetical protein CIK05_07295 [Bdellovibrio sp. qaytius]